MDNKAKPRKKIRLLAKQVLDLLPNDDEIRTIYPEISLPPYTWKKEILPNFNHGLERKFCS